MSIRDLIPWRSGQDLEVKRRGSGHPLATLHHEIDRLFDDMWRGFDRPVFGELGRWEGLASPRVDVSEDEEAVRVSAELPGMGEDDVEVVLSDGRLTIKGEKKSEEEKSEEGYIYRERSYGTFQRSFPVGADIAADKVEAVFENGVLTVTPGTEPDADGEGRARLGRPRTHPRRVAAVPSEGRMWRGHRLGQ